jgi:hypothetical protein
MSEVANSLDKLRRIHDREAWHSAALKESLTGMTAEQSAARPVGDVSVDAWAETLRQLDDYHERLLRTVAELDDYALPEKVAGKDYSTHFLLDGVVRHHVYHAGQIALLKKSFSS